MGPGKISPRPAKASRFYSCFLCLTRKKGGIFLLGRNLNNRSGAGNSEDAV